ncbi:hypothetical protein [Allobacillus halotolerans]|uniref:Cytochrome C and Quinol oxidase polypeptide I n=1 Tax=Allobacillus halotolerans TaxID=570278 RepID=A0ABS6GLF4_9BACI|nr:hypothetical protein [Allobacillus halotolerans]MBU6079933.1 hypothetical protein [Allobacillus halotolerans]
MSGIKSDTAIKLPISFILCALVAFVTSLFILLVNSQELLAGQFRFPEIWMGAHFLLLGFAVMIAMGAMYQLVPVAFLTPIWNQSFGFVQFYVTVVGIIFLSIMLGINPSLAIYGGILTVIGILMFTFQMLKTLAKRKENTAMSHLVLAAILCFLLTILAGLSLTWNFAFGGMANHSSILYSHIAFGVAGWFTLLIFGFSYKLVPMFSLSHGASMKRAKPSFYMYVFGLLLLILSFWLNQSFIQPLSWLFLLIGFGLFALDIKEILTKRLRRKLDKPFHFATLAIINGWVIHVAAFFISLFHIDDPVIWSWLIFLYIFCWIIFSILGYLFKIVPFLWWTHKYAERIGKESVPTLKEMINEKVSGYLFIVFYVALFGILISTSIQSGVTLFFFLAILTVNGLLYALSIVAVLFK